MGTHLICSTLLLEASEVSANNVVISDNAAQMARSARMLCEYSPASTVLPFVVYHICGISNYDVSMSLHDICAKWLGVFVRTTVSLLGERPIEAPPVPRRWDGRVRSSSCPKESAVYSLIAPEVLA